MRTLVIVLLIFFTSAVCAIENQYLEPSEENEDYEVQEARFDENVMYEASNDMGSDIDPGRVEKQLSNSDRHSGYDRGDKVPAKNSINVTNTGEVVGWVEKVRIYPGNVILKAKIDTGAKTSSLHVTTIKLIERNKEEWIHFTVTGLGGKKVQFKRKVKRIATIKRHFEDPHRRLVVLLGVCLGNTYHETEVNLIDRSGLNYPLLIGRQFLKERFIVDSSQIYSVKPNCEEAPKE